MKLPLLIISGLLASCGSQQYQDKAPIETPREIKAFIDICIKESPSFINSERKADLYGISNLISLGEGKLGFNNDQSLGVQIKPNKECVITTPSQNKKHLTSKFMQAISNEIESSTPKRVPFKATVNGQAFIFTHNRRGGEAYVMLKK